MKFQVEEKVPLAPLATLKVGGDAQFFVEIETISELTEAVAWAHEHEHPITILGGGSNVLVPDTGIKGLVIKNSIGGVTTEKKDAHTVTIVSGAGVVFDDLVSYTVDNAWWGLENLSAIPGCVGATPIQNVGAYGVEVQDYILWVEVLDTTDMQIKTITNAACAFAYRNSLFKTKKGKQYIVTRVAFNLSTKPKPILEYRDVRLWFENKKETPTLKEIRAAIMRIRSRKFPDWKTTGTAGSFFKNPIISQDIYQEIKTQYPDIPGYTVAPNRVKVPLGWVLDKLLHLKGCREHAVGMYEAQAWVLVNYGDATARDIELFANNIQKAVYTKIGIHIEWEVTKLT